ESVHALSAHGHQPAPEPCPLPLLDALPISARRARAHRAPCRSRTASAGAATHGSARGTAPRAGTAAPCARATPSATVRCCAGARSEEHTSELQSRSDPVCRLPLENKKPCLL